MILGFPKTKCAAKGSQKSVSQMGLLAVPQKEARLAWRKTLPFKQWDKVERSDLLLELKNAEFFPGTRTLLHIFSGFKLWKQRVLWKSCGSGMGHWRDEASGQQELYTAWEHGTSASSSEMGPVLGLNEHSAKVSLWPKGLEQMGSEKSSFLTSKDPNHD